MEMTSYLPVVARCMVAIANVSVNSIKMKLVIVIYIKKNFVEHHCDKIIPKIMEIVVLISPNVFVVLQLLHAT